MSFQFAIRVYWEDTDAGGIVFYANYLKFFERARTEWLRSLGIEQSRLREATGGMFVVSHTQLRYLQPARLDDELLVTAALQKFGSGSLVIAQQARLRSAHAATPGRQPGRDGVPGPDQAANAPRDIASDLLCEGSIRIGWVDAARLRPGRIPLTVLEKIAPR